MVTFIFAIIVAASGFGFIFQGWKNKPLQVKSTELRLTTFVGWVCVVSGGSLLLLSAGAEFGLVYALCGISFIPMFLCIYNHQNRNKNELPVTVYKQLSLKPKRLGLNVFHFLIVVPLSLTFAILLSLITSQQFGWETANQLTFVVLSFPVIWAFASYFYLYSERKLVSGGSMVAATAIIASIAFLSN